MNQMPDNRAVLPDLRIIFHPSVDQPEFTRQLSDVVDHFIQQKGDPITCLESDREDQGLPCAPAITFRHPNRGDIHYMALPEGQESAPFKEMIKGDLITNHRISDGTFEVLTSYDRSTEIIVFITSHCPNCPRAVRSALTVALLNRNISTAIIDGEQFPELAKRYHIQSVPMVILNRELMINRVLTPDELVGKIISMGTDTYHRDVFLSCLETGNLEQGLNRLLSDDRCSEYFISVWEKSTLHLRMGLLYIAEQALEKQPAIFNPIVPELIRMLTIDDTSLRGDTVDLLGQIGHPDALEPLKRVLNDDNPDVVEIAREALMRIGT